MHGSFQLSFGINGKLHKSETIVPRAPTLATFTFKHVYFLVGLVEGLTVTAKIKRNRIHTMIR